MEYSFPWNDSPIIEKQYEKPNYMVRLTGNNTGRALIFFSSHGIYFPNTKDEFVKKIENEDYYDWINISKHRVIGKYFEKIIFVRDIYKQWYITGINSSYNTIDKLIGFLKSETADMKITTCGSSAGGYMALLAGLLLNADRIIDSCGQHNLEVYLDDPLISKYKNDFERSKYFDLRKYINGHEQSIYYFYPNQCEDDVIQCKALENTNIKIFSMKGDKHGETIRTICYPFVLTMPRERLDRLQKKYEHIVINRADFFNETVPLHDRILFYYRHFVNLIKKQ